jgi:hypothetical protein
LWITSRTLSGSLKTTSAILVGGIRCAASRTICARRHVTTEPLLRRTIRSSRLPSSLLISRSPTRAANLASRPTTGRERSFDNDAEDPPTEPANVAGQM